MLYKLREIAEAVVATPVSSSGLRRFGTQIDRPSLATAMAVELSKCALNAVDPTTPWATQSLADANDLLRFVANLPDWITNEIAAHDEFVLPQRAWEEPNSGAYVGLCATVQDVWEHLFGPEAQDDHQTELALANIDFAGAQVLDFGCGVGHFTMFLAHQGVRVRAYDIDRVKLAFLALRAAWRQVDDVVVIGEPRPPYDIILALNVLDHLKEPGRQAYELTRWLVPGGRLLVCADFPADGWHQSEPQVVQDTFAALFGQLAVERHWPASRLDVLRCHGTATGALHRKVARVSRSAMRPSLRANAGIGPVDGSRDQFLLIGNRFYLRPCQVNREGASILHKCDGTRSVRQLARLSCAPESEVWDLVDFLWREHWVTLS